MADWVSGKVTKVEYWTDALFSLYVRAPVHPFTAGQFTKLGLEIDGERVQRAYSYVNAPGNPDLEFYLVTVPEGKLSPRLAALKPGDEVLVVSEAAGFFVLEEVPDCDTLWMLATGTALGPYLSILQEGKDLERFNNLVLVHAVRYAADLSYLPLMRELEQRYAGKLRIQTVVSRETVEGSLTGRVPFLIETGALEEAVGLPMTTDTRMPIQKGWSTVAHLTTSPTAEAAVPMAGASRADSPTPARMVTRGVTRMSIFVSLDTALPSSAAMTAMKSTASGPPAPLPPDRVTLPRALAA